MLVAYKEEPFVHLEKHVACGDTLCGREYAGRDGEMIREDWSVGSNEASDDLLLASYDAFRVCSKCLTEVKKRLGRIRFSEVETIDDIRLCVKQDPEHPIAKAWADMLVDLDTFGHDYVLDDFIDHAVGLIASHGITLKDM